MCCKGCPTVDMGGSTISGKCCTTYLLGRDATIDVELTDKFRGAMVGTAVGDALGAPMEGRSRVPAEYLTSLQTSPPNLSYTDDTAMTIAVARSLIECEGFDGAHMAATLADGYENEPWRGYGAGPPRVFANLARGVPWDEAAASLFGGEGSYGNGAAMRVAPVALHAYPSQHGAAQIAHRTALLTHTHREGIDGAVVQAVATTALLGHNSPSEIASVVMSHVKSSVFQSKLMFIDRHIGDRPLNELAEVLGTGIAAHTSVPTALACFLAHAASFTDAIKAAISLGGDTDTIAAMTGALAGAHNGYSTIPETWRQVEGADDLVMMADALAERRQSE